MWNEGRYGDLLFANNFQGQESHGSSMNFRKQGSMVAYFPQHLTDEALHHFQETRIKRTRSRRGISLSLTG